MLNHCSQLYLLPTRGLRLAFSEPQHRPVCIFDMYRLLGLRSERGTEKDKLSTSRVKGPINASRRETAASSKRLCAYILFPCLLRQNLVFHCACQKLYMHLSMKLSALQLIQVGVQASTSTNAHEGQGKAAAPIISAHGKRLGCALPNVTKIRD